MTLALTAGIALVPWVRAVAAPEGACLQDDRHKLDNASFAEAIGRAAVLLENCGVRAGDTIAVLLPECVEYAVTVFAAWRIGAAVLPLDPSQDPDVSVYQLADAGVVTLVRCGELPALDVPAGVRVLDRSEMLGPERADVRPSGQPPAPADFALVSYAGSGGRRSGVLLDHRGISAVAEGVRDRVGLLPEDRVLTMFGSWTPEALVLGLVPAMVAGSSFAFGDLLEMHRPSIVVAPANAVYPGGRPLIRFEASSGTRLLRGYGVLEGTVLSTLQAAASPAGNQTLGASLPDQEVKIMSANGDLLSDGQLGEVVLRGAGLMRGYLGKPEQTGRVVRQGWLHTGDVGYLEPGGDLVVVGTLDAMIVRDGERVFLPEVERVLRTHPDVLAARVVAGPDPVLSQVPVAYVMLHEDAECSIADLLAHCRQGLKSTHVPDAVYLVEELS